MIRVLALMEARSLTGPAKNLIEFARLASRPRAGLPAAEVALTTFERSTRSSAAFIRAAQEAGLGVFAIPERRAFDPAVLGRLRGIAAQRRPDIIQTHNVKSHFLVRLAGLHRRHCWIAFHHGYTSINLKDRLYNQLNRWSLPAAHRVVAVCRSFARDLERSGVAAGRIAIRHNMVQPFTTAAPEEVLRLRSQLGIPDDARVILCAGRLSHEKGHADLVRAIGRLQQQPQTPPFRLVLAGDGPERKAIEQLCARLAVADRVLLTGHQPDLRPYYSMADVVALPSHSEGSPNVLLEAMSAGIAVAATAVGGVPEIATDEQDALLVARSDSRAMAAAIGRLLVDQELRRRLGERAAGVAARYTPEAYCRQVLELYQEALASGPAACVSRS